MRRSRAAMASARSRLRRRWRRTPAPAPAATTQVAAPAKAATSTTSLAARRDALAQHPDLYERGGDRRPTARSLHAQAGIGGGGPLLDDPACPEASEPQTFAGPAVAFLPTVTFGRITASLR